jgi:hypothetical protein
MNNPVLPMMSELARIQSNRQSGRLRLQKRDGAELNLFFENGFLVHAQYRWTFGIAAFQEALTWHNYTTVFADGIASPIQSISEEDRLTLEQGSGVTETKQNSMPVTFEGYFYAQKHTASELNEFEVRVLTHSNGINFTDLQSLTEMSGSTLENLIRQLIQKKVLTVEKSPCTPERLKALRLRKKEVKSKGLMGLFGKKSIELTELEFQVYDMLNGAVTLWDVHLNLGLAREQVWEAYVALKKRDLVENLS